jgi:DNA-binding NarL/FixJ family response regulator
MSTSAASAGPPLRIVIADDQASVREGLVLLLGGIAATRRLAAEHPGTAIVILTTYADDGSVLEALRAGARSYLTKDAGRGDIASALHAAAGGLTVLDARVQATLLAAATAPGSAAAAAGSTGTPGSTGIPGSAVSANSAATERGAGGTASPAPPPDGLTQREAEILALIARGLNNPEIAARLFLSNHTVKTHISRIFAKTGSRDRPAAIGYAHRHGIG